MPGNTRSLGWTHYADMASRAESAVGLGNLTLYKLGKGIWVKIQAKKYKKAKPNSKSKTRDQRQ